MDENTLLFIYGDHGIKEDGNHGGSTFKEVWSSIIVTSKNDIYDKSKLNVNIDLKKYYLKNKKYVTNSIHDNTANDHEDDDKADTSMIRKWYYQIDLVPTISFILNTDVPSLNQGLCIYEICKLYNQYINEYDQNNDNKLTNNND